MKVKMQSGVILESDNEMVNKMRLNNGGVEVKGSSGSRKGSRRATSRKKDADKSKDASENKEDASEDKK